MLIKSLDSEYFHGSIGESKVKEVIFLRIYRNIMSVEHGRDRILRSLDNIFPGILNPENIISTIVYQARNLSFSQAKFPFIFQLHVDFAKPQWTGGGRSRSVEIDLFTTSAAPPQHENPEQWILKGTEPVRWQLRVMRDEEPRLIYMLVGDVLKQENRLIAQPASALIMNLLPTDSLLNYQPDSDKFSIRGEPEVFPNIERSGDLIVVGYQLAKHSGKFIEVKIPLIKPGNLRYATLAGN